MAWPLRAHRTLVVRLPATLCAHMFNSFDKKRSNLSFTAALTIEPFVSGNLFNKTVILCVQRSGQKQCSNGGNGYHPKAGNLSILSIQIHSELQSSVFIHMIRVPRFVFLSSNDRTNFTPNEFSSN